MLMNDYNQIKTTTKDDYNFENIEVSETFGNYSIGPCTFPYLELMGRLVNEHLLVFKNGEHQPEEYFKMINEKMNQGYIYLERAMNEKSRSVKNWHGHLFLMDEQVINL